jgi:F-type H+-transporting ATPase subunit b
MNLFALLASPREAGQIDSLARTFGVDWSHLIAQIISFCIVSFLLYRYAYKPVLKMLAERRQLIQNGLADAEEIKAKLARTEAQRREVILQANTQASKLIEEAHRTAARVREQETQRATTEAQQIISKAHQSAEQDHARMLIQLKQEVGRLVVEATGKLAGRVLTAEDQRRLMQETSKRIAA